MKSDRPTVRLAGGRRVKMDDGLFAILYAAGAFDEEEKQKPEDQPPRPDDSGIILRVMLAAAAALFLVAFLRSMIR